MVVPLYGTLPALRNSDRRSGREGPSPARRSEGLLGTGTFEGCLLGETTLGAVRALRPTVKGTANILGTARWLIDRDDPVVAGFLVS